MMLTYLKQSWFFFRRNLSTLVAIQLPFIVLLNVLLAQVDLAVDPQNSAKLTESLFSISIFNLLVMPIYWGATILFMQSSLQGTAISSTQALLGGLRYWPRLLLIFTFTGLAVFAGLMAFIVPGLYIAIRLSLADYYSVCQQRSAIASLKLSWQNTSDYFWLLLQGLAMIFLGSLALEMVLANLLGSLFGDNPYVQLPLNVAFDLLNILMMIFAFRIYSVIEAENNRV